MTEAEDSSTLKDRAKKKLERVMGPLLLAALHDPRTVEIMLNADGRLWQRLQSGAQGATGQMQAIGFANQLASQQANQLLQIRALLIAQQNIIATRYRECHSRK